ncbi:MAG: YceI family protein [Bacteroidales bacterium]|nr:YceI family protein [Bacteroidales bacterium]
MKTFKFLAVALISAFIMQGCMNPEGEKTETQEAQKEKSGEGISYIVNADNSSVKWLGTKPTGEHYGYVPITEGNLTVKNNMITGGSFTMDISSLDVEDLEDPEKNAKLTGHLKSPDFFNTDTFPTSEFVITGVEELNDKMSENGMELTHKISGNLTIKDITKNISFNANVNIMDNKLKAKTPQFLIDRTKWDVNWGSKSVFGKAVNTVVHDDIGITIKLHTKKQN